MSTFVLNEEKMFSDIADGIAIIINSETGIYYGMNGFGTNVFENILSGCSTTDILAAMNAIDGAPDDCEQKLTDFVDALVNFEIIKQGSCSGSVSLNATLAQQDAFTMMVQEYSDAQELLLADPIHEVKNETGWGPDKDVLEDNEQKLKEKHAKIGQ